MRLVLLCRMLRQKKQARHLTKARNAEWATPKDRKATADKMKNTRAANKVRTHCQSSESTI